MHIQIIVTQNYWAVFIGNVLQTWGILTTSCSPPPATAIREPFTQPVGSNDSQAAGK
jgi:hypothetical protein